MYGFVLTRQARVQRMGVQGEGVHFASDLSVTNQICTSEVSLWF